MRVRFDPFAGLLAAVCAALVVAPAAFAVAALVDGDPGLSIGGVVAVALVAAYLSGRSLSGLRTAARAVVDAQILIVFVALPFLAVGVPLGISIPDPHAEWLGVAGVVAVYLVAARRTARGRYDRP